MSARRVKSLHHNLGTKNVVFHREHRSKKNRRIKRPDSLALRLYRMKKKGYME